MIQCNECGASQYEGALFCSECGRFLIDTSGKTTVLPFSDFFHHSPPPPLVEHNLEPTSDPKHIMFIIPASRRRRLLDLVDQIRVGRADPDSGVRPELDLSDDGGIDKGVSRLHAAIQSTAQGVVLIDLGSTNGTLLNNYRLPAERPYPLRSGDEIRFGDLLLHVFFDIE
jgi:hypothetical protein